MADETQAEAISCDEIGLATARIAGTVVRSAFQPIYEVRGNVLEPVAVEGFARPYRAGAAIPPSTFLSRLGPEDRRRAERTCLLLHALNVRHVGDGDMAHVVGIDAFVLDRAGLPDIGLLKLACRTAPRGSTARLRAAGSLDPGAQAELAEALRELGMLVCVGGPGTNDAGLDALGHIRPEMVYFDGVWFRRVAEDDLALRLAAQLVRRLRAEGARVLVRGLETRRQLASAIAIGCDLFQGFVLARPALAGSGIDLGPRSPDIEDDVERKIVSLHRA